MRVENEREGVLGEGGGGEQCGTVQYMWWWAWAEEGGVTVEGEGLYKEGEGGGQSQGGAEGYIDCMCMVYS